MGVEVALVPGLSETPCCEEDAEDEDGKFHSRIYEVPGSNVVSVPPGDPGVEFGFPEPMVVRKT